MMVQVLPAYAGMILVDADVVILRMGAPRVCGDDPAWPTWRPGSGKCSPRMRG